MSVRWFRILLDWNCALDDLWLPVRYLLTALIVAMGAMGIIFLFSGLKTRRTDTEKGDRETIAGIMLIMIIAVFLFIVFG